jgi:glycosyltransferase involved in cell wall biosynthesis
MSEPDRVRVKREQALLSRHRDAGTSQPAAEARPDLSVVIPLHDEEGSIAELVQRLDAVLQTTTRTSEVLLVDDGSRDGTAREIRRLLPDYPRFSAIRLRRNFGQTAALAAGFDHASGAVVVTMDGDLQNPPEDIPKLLAKLDEGYDLVSGWRVDRRDAYLPRIIPSRIANYLISRLTGTRLHDYGCSLKAYRREILQDIQIHGDMHRFLPAFAGALGARIAELPVEHRPRRNGRSKYGLWRTLIVLVDMISIRFVLPYSFKPLKSFGLLGLALLGGGSAICVYLAYLRLFMYVGLSDRPLLLLGVLLIVMGVQFLGLGVLADLQTRILHGRDQGTYAILERIGFPGADIAATAVIENPRRPPAGPIAADRELD